MNDEPPRRPSRLAAFIREQKERILAEWEGFARALPVGGEMDVAALRDHAAEMLEVIAADLDTLQTDRQELDKAQGRVPRLRGGTATAAEEHGAGRAGSGFTINQMVAEFRALRASVIRSWMAQMGSATLDDLAELTRFNEAIDQAIAESTARFARDLAASKDRFLAMLGHDLRTPIGAVLTSSRFMLDAGELAEPYLTLVSRIVSSASRMNDMVGDLLDFTRTRFGDGIPISPAPMDARKLVHDVVTEVAASHPDSAVRVETSGDLHGEWDAARLAQAVSNLVGNAVQHGERGAPVQVSARGSARGVELSVTNDGPVIPRDRMRQLFDPMVPSAGGGRDPQHLGLGLYIVDRIVAAHGGTVDVKSSRASGTSFTIRLPRRAPR